MQYIAFKIAEMDFSEYLIQKKIDANAFQTGDPARFQEWRALFTDMHPDSFTAQKKFLINEIRRRFHLPADSE